MSENKKSLASWMVWASRMGGLLVLLSCFYANEAIDHDQLSWHANAAFGIVFLFGLFGSMHWIRSTYTQAELQASRKSKIVKAFWWLLMAVVILLMLVSTLASYFDF